MSELQEETMRMLLKNLMVRHPFAEVVGANEIVHPEESREDYEPYFDVSR